MKWKKSEEGGKTGGKDGTGQQIWEGAWVVMVAAIAYCVCVGGRSVTQSPVQPSLVPNH